MNLILLPLLLLPALTEAMPPWMEKLMPKVCISCLSNKGCTPFLTQNAMEGIPQHLHQDLRQLQSSVCENEEHTKEYAADIDDLVAQVLRSRARALTPSKHNFQEEEDMIRKIFDKAPDCFHSGRPEATLDEKTSLKNSRKTSRDHKIISAYDTCVGNYYVPSHVHQWKEDLLEAISSGTVKMEEFRPKMLSAVRADFASLHAHRIKCFAAIEERIKFEPTDRKKLKVLPGIKKEELVKRFKTIDKNLEEAKKELAEWRTRQAEIVKHIFDDLLNQKSQTEVLESQENRLNALVQLARTDAKDQFLINTDKLKKLHPGAQKMMKEFLNCVSNPKLEWSSELRRELKKETHNFWEDIETNEMAVDVERAKFEYFWGRHLVRIHLDSTKAMADSLNCFATTERKLFYKNAHVKQTNL